MFSIPFPPRPDVEQYKKRAKELVQASQAGDPQALHAFAADWFHALAKLMDGPGHTDDRFVRDLIDESAAELTKVVDKERQRAAGKFAIANAQFVIANLHGFANWKDFA